MVCTCGHRARLEPLMPRESPAEREAREESGLEIRAEALLEQEATREVLRKKW